MFEYIALDVLAKKRSFAKKILMIFRRKITWM